MQMFLKPSNQVTVLIGPLLSDSDGKTPQESIAYNASGIDVDVIKGADTKVDVTLANSAGDGYWIHRANGYYSLTLSAGHTDTLGSLRVTFNLAGVLPCWADFLIMDATNLDNFFGGVAPIECNAVQASGSEAAMDNLELDYDGTGYEKANSTIGTCTANSDMRGTDSAALATALTTHDNKIGTIENLGTGATLGKNMRDAAGATFVTGTDSHEAIRNQGDAAWNTATGFATSGALITHDGKLDTAQLDLDKITGVDGVTLATLQALYAPNKIVPDAAGTAVVLAASQPNYAPNKVVPDAAGTANTVVPDAAGTAPTASEIKTAVEAAGSSLAAILTAIGTLENLGTGATLAKNLRDLAGATFVTADDSNEALRNRGDGTWATATGFATAEKQDLITGVDGVTLATLQALYAPNKTVPDAAGVVAALLDTLETHGDSAWATAAGFAAEGAKMDLVDAPNATAILAFVAGVLGGTIDGSVDLENALKRILSVGVNSSDITGSSIAHKNDANSATVVTRSVATGGITKT